MQFLKQAGQFFIFCVLIRNWSVKQTTRGMSHFVLFNVTNYVTFCSLCANMKHSHHYSVTEFCHLFCDFKVIYFNLQIYKLGKQGVLKRLKMITSFGQVIMFCTQFCFNISALC